MKLLNKDFIFLIDFIRPCRMVAHFKGLKHRFLGGSDTRKAASSGGFYHLSQRYPVPLQDTPNSGVSLYQHTQRRDAQQP